MFVELSAGRTSVPPRIAASTERGLLAAMPGYADGILETKLVSVFAENRDLPAQPPGDDLALRRRDRAAARPHGRHRDHGRAHRRRLGGLDAGARAAGRARPGRARSGRPGALARRGGDARARLRRDPRREPQPGARPGARRRGRRHRLGLVRGGRRRSGRRLRLHRRRRSPYLQRGVARARDARDLGRSVPRRAGARPADRELRASSPSSRASPSSRTRRARTSCRGSIRTTPSSSGEVLAGTREGRTSPEQITVYKSMGHAVEDAAAAGLVYRRALEEGAGTEVEL